MALKIIMVGKTSKGFEKDGIDEYLKRLKKYIKLSWIEIPDIKKTNKLNAVDVKQLESRLILEQCKPTDFVLLCDEKGKSFTSMEFSKYLEKSLSSYPSLNIVIGGAYGFSEEVYKRANGKIALSEMTFSHQMIRVLLSEQIYRAFTILKGDPYHNS